MESMVEVKNLRKEFGPVTAVDDISFRVDRGEVLGFLGPNGAGKSTTMKIITGFLAPTSGTAVIVGDDISLRPIAVKRRIGYLPEGAPAYPDMTPARFLDFVAEVRGLRGQEKARRIADTVAKVNLESVLDQSIETLSKGFKRRVGLAQAILHDPEVLILDEPTDGLDPNQKHEVRALIREMAADKVIILSTHILEEVDAVCTRAIIIAGGKLVADETPESLETRSRYHNAVTLTIRDTDAADAQQSLGALPNVHAVEALEACDGQISFQVYPKNGVPIAPGISHLALNRGWEVEELHVERGRLDEVFRSITTSTQGTLS